MTGADKLAVAIPAHRPSEALLELVRHLAEKGFGAIVLVDDGSGPEYRDTFARLAAIPGVQVLRHAIELGKGAALKTAFNHVLCAAPEIAGVVAADVEADPDEIERVAVALADQPGGLAPGASIPPLSRILDRLTPGMLGVPQTGVRGIPTTLLPRLLRIPSSFALPRFGIASLLSAVLDNLVFALTILRFGNILASLAIGRAFSLPFHYLLLRDAVFHRRAGLAKYIAWAVVNGGCSYAGILLLTTHYGMSAIAAKLLVETLLFPINFAVQRAFVFRAASGERSRVPVFALALGAVFAALVGLEIYGFRTADLFTQDIWHPAGIRRFERYGEVYAIVSVVLMLAAPRYFAAFFAAMMAVLTAVSVGLAALSATAFFFISANALGARVLGRMKFQAVEDQVCATLLGTGIYAFAMTFLARVPVNYPVVWGAILAIPVLLDLRGVRDRVSGWLGLLLPARQPSAGERAAFALLLFVLIAHWLVVLKPEASADGLAMHLSIPANIGLNHRLTLEPSKFLWAVMPMAADLVYAIAYLPGGEFGARLVVYAMLLAACALLYCGLRRWTTPAAACLITASFAATPIVQLVTGAMFVENFLAAMILGVVTAIWRFGDTGERRYFYTAMALSGTAIAVKLGALAFVLTALAFAFVEARRHWRSLGPRPAAACAAGVALAVAMAAPPYTVAYVKTRNPIFPYLNNKFRSPMLASGIVIADARFKKPLSVRTPFLLTFHTDGYYEGQRGSLGFQYLAFVPLGLLGFAVVRRRAAVVAAVVATAASAVILSTEPNARYLYPAMPLALIPVGATLAWTAEHQRGLYRVLIAFLVAGVGLNLSFLPAASYYHKDFALKQPFSRADRDRYMSEAVPIRKVIEYFNRAHPKEGVLLTGEGANAGLNGDIYENHWHQVSTLLKIREAPNVPAILKLMNGWHVRYFIGRKPAPGELAEPPLLAEFMASCTLPEFEAGDAYLARLEPGCGAKNITAPVIVVRPGYYDDWDPAIVYQGAWTKESNAPGPDRGTRTHAETPGAQMSLAFDGRELYYVFARMPNGGIASVTIDGAPREPIDLYYQIPDWQHKVGWCCFSPGRHVVVIRATGEKNPASSGYSLDLDSFSVLDVPDR